MHPDIATALRLQELDLKIEALKKEIETLPRQIAQIEKQLEGHKKQIEVDHAALAGNQRDRKKLEGVVQDHQQKVAKLRDQMITAKTNEQLHAFQHEVAWEEGEIRKCEDRILDLMSEAEPLEANVKKAEAALKEEMASVEAQKKQAQEATARDRAELAAIAARRAEAAAGLSAKMRVDYERLRQRNKGGIALAEAVDGVCTACHMSLRPQLFQDIKQGDAVLTCESCKRILYYLTPTQVENELI